MNQARCCVYGRVETDRHALFICPAAVLGREKQGCPWSDTKNDSVLVEIAVNLLEWNIDGTEQQGSGVGGCLNHLQQWHPPPSGCFKLNTDAPVNPETGFYTIGVVIAMQEKMVVGQLSAKNAEAMAVCDGLVLAWKRGFSIAVMERDSLQVVQRTMGDKALPVFASVRIAWDHWDKSCWYKEITRPYQEGFD
ncbi:Ribonuclease H-like domain containing protein [Forsythia ovata]|uniref:Ribonuclease H-like domain containing protein n=1 Tax=Forsythia ovata TaxID=205694 RepID=A0ABD1WF96_9LAMI